MGSQIPDDGKAGPQSQLKDAWMWKSQKGGCYVFALMTWMAETQKVWTVFLLLNNGLTTTCIFLMWFAWQTPWKTSGMQTGGTKCLSATLEYVVVVNFNAFPPVSQTYSVNMRRQTGTVRPRCVRWFEGLALVFLPTRLLSHPRSAWVASSLNDHTSKEPPT